MYNRDNNRDRDLFRINCLVIERKMTNQGCSNDRNVFAKVSIVKPS